MVIIQMRGGMGNQMFQYALYHSFKEKGIPVQIDETSFYKIRGEQGTPALHLPCLKERFGVDYRCLNHQKTNVFSKMGSLFRKKPPMIFERGGGNGRCIYP